MKRFSIAALILLLTGITIISCQKELSEENGLPDVLATGSLRDTFGECFPDSVHGTFYNGVLAGSDTAYVEIKVNVTAAGSYNILSDLQNGLQFGDSGYFSATGINTVLLKAIGTANQPTTSVFTISFDSSVCSFIVDIKDSTGTGLGGQDSTGGGTDSSDVDSWGFSDSLGTYSGFIDTAALLNVAGISFLAVSGITTNGDSAMALNIILPGGAIVSGTYTTAQGSSFSFVGGGTTGIIYSAGTSEDFSIIITDYTNGVVTGTFSGEVADPDGNTGVVTGGSFSATVQ